MFFYVKNSSFLKKIKKFLKNYPIKTANFYGGSEGGVLIMALKKFHYQIDKKEYIELYIDEKDLIKINDLILNNKQVNKRIYQDKVNLSRFYVSEIETLIGHEFADPNSDPYLIAENILREAVKEKAITLLDEALELLTNLQKEVLILKIVNGLTFRDIVKLVNLSYKTIHEIYEAAIKKLRKFYRQFTWLKEFYPHLFE